MTNNPAFDLMGKHLTWHKGMLEFVVRGVFGAMSVIVRARKSKKTWIDAAKWMTLAQICRMMN